MKNVIMIQVTDDEVSSDASLMVNSFSTGYYITAGKK